MTHFWPNKIPGSAIYPVQMLIWKYRQTKLPHNVIRDRRIVVISDKILNYIIK